MGDLSGAVERAKLLIAVRRFEDALEILRREPEGGEARFWSAVALSGKQRWKQALAEAERSIADAPEVSRSHAIRSDILRHLGKTKPCLEAAQEAVRLDPLELIAHTMLAQAATEARKWDMAESAAAEALRLAPESTVAHQVAGYVALKRKSRKRAARHLREALELDPFNPEALNNLALTMPRLRPRSQSIQLLEMAVQADPTSALFKDNLYVQASAHVRGLGFDRLDLLILPPIWISIVLSALIFVGWIRPPAIVSIAVVVLMFGLLVTHVTLDRVRNRRRLRSLAQPTRSLYRRRYYRDTFAQSLYFAVSLGIPGAVVAILDYRLGLSLVVQWLIVFAVIDIWALLGPRTWRRFVRPRLGSNR
jgi:tetratricopeptide (TPR) repeat protein